MNDRKLVLIGGGGHALSTIAALPPCIDVAGYVSNRTSELLGGRLNRFGTDAEFLENPESRRYSVLLAVVSGRDCSLAMRRRLMEMYAGYESPVCVAPSAVVINPELLGDGTVVFHRAVINVAATTGRHCVVNTGAIIEHGCRIGDNVFIGPGAVICGDVKIADDVYVGAGAVIRPGISVCKGAIIGAGAAVVGDITVPGTYAGVPAKRIK